MNLHIKFHENIFLTVNFIKLKNKPINLHCQVKQFQHPIIENICSTYVYILIPTRCYKQEQGYCSLYLI